MDQEKFLVQKSFQCKEIVVKENLGQNKFQVKKFVPKYWLQKFWVEKIVGSKKGGTINSLEQAEVFLLFRVGGWSGVDNAKLSSSRLV